MAVVDTALRRFNAEFSSLVDKHVVVRTVNGDSYEGILLGYETSRYNIILRDARTSKGETYPRLIVYGHVIVDVRLTEAPLDMEELARRLEEVFPKMIKYIPEARVITVLERIRVTERGVEGTGPIAERVRSIFDKFVEEWKEKQKLPA
ncbi:MAG: Lsm family RNA-binding protein [Thermofilaceae archaeon]